MRTQFQLACKQIISEVFHRQGCAFAVTYTKGCVLINFGHEAPEFELMEDLEKSFMAVDYQFSMYEMLDGLYLILSPREGEE